jgi:hypothetical protein
LVIFKKEFCSCAAADDEFWGTEVSVLAPCRDGEVPLEPSPSISIAVTASDGEEGVVLPQG